MQSGEEGAGMSSGWLISFPPRAVVPQFSGRYDLGKDCPFAHGGPYPRSMCDNFVVGCHAEANSDLAECGGEEDHFSTGVAIVCLRLPGSLAKAICFAVGLLVRYDETCRHRHSVATSFCDACFRICVRNSYVDRPPRSR